MKKQIAVLIALTVAASPVLMAGPVDSSKEVAPAQTQPPENPWRFSLALNGWATAVNGTISAGDRSADIDVDFSELVDHLDMAFMATAQVGYKRWGLIGDLVYARLHADVPPPRGVLFSSTHEVLKETLGTILLSYRVVDSPTNFVDLLAGARIYDFYTQLVFRPALLQQGVNRSGTENWVDPVFGLRGRYYVSRAWFLHLYGDIGGFGAGSEFSWQVLGGVGVQASRWCDINLGYRALYFDYESGRTTQEITTHGPIIGAIIHF